jgi:hypothetical protein
MQEGDEVWSWSEAFTEIVRDLMRDRPTEGAAQIDWPKHLERLGWWRRQVETARELYKQGNPEALRLLHDYWRAIADDAPEQARIAGETYRQLYFREST